jgi:hypothetical protein
MAGEAKDDPVPLICAGVAACGSNELRCATAPFSPAWVVLVVVGVPVVDVVVLAGEDTAVLDVVEGGWSAPAAEVVASSTSVETAPTDSSARLTAGTRLTGWSPVIRWTIRILVDSLLWIAA